MLRVLLKLIYPLALLLMAWVGYLIVWPKSDLAQNSKTPFPIALSQAEIFPSKLFSADELFGSQKPVGGRLTDITTWKDFNAPELADGLGYAAYWRELPELEPGSYEIAFEFATSAYEAYLIPLGSPERALRIAAGRPGRNAGEEIPLLKRNILNFHVQDGDHWVLAVNLSNFHRTYGGFWLAPRIAPAAILSTEANQKNALNFAIAGSMIIILFYCYMLFNRRPSDLPALFLSLTCLAILMRLIGIENLLSFFWNEVETPWIFEVSCRMEFGSMALITLVFLEFLRRTFTKTELPRYVYYVCHSFNIVLLGLVLVTPVTFFSQVVGFYQANIMLHVIIMMVITTYALKRKEEGAGYMLASALIPLVTAAIDVFQYRQGGGTSSFVSHFGGAFFIFLQSQILAKRFARAYEQVAHLSQNLQTEVKRQTRQIRNIMDNVPEGLFLIGKELRIQGQCSAYVEVLFPEARLNNLPDLLNFNMRIDRSNLDMTVSVLLSIIGEDTIAWEINSEHLFTELETQDQRLFTFQWHPIIQGDHVEEMLVIVRDTTELRNLRQKTLHHEQEMVLISALAKARSYHAFRDQARAQLVSLHSVWATHRLARDKSYIRVILAMLHTLKGNARQIGFTKLARDLHDFEQSLIDLRETHGEEDADFAPILETGFRVIEGELKFIDSLHRRYWGDNDSKRERSKESFSERFLDRWADLERDIKKTAETLGKPEPEIRLVQSGEIRLPIDFQNGLFNALGHLLRNAVDHGLESRDERQRNGKSPEGLILVQMRVVRNGLMVSLEDDGRGLDVEALRSKAPKSSQGHASPGYIMNLVFSSGLSTAKTVTQLSGRGVGMEAVKIEVERIGGTLTLVPRDPEALSEDAAFIPFRVEMNFPGLI